MKDKIKIMTYSVNHTKFIMTYESLMDLVGDLISGDLMDNVGQNMHH